MDEMYSAMPGSPITYLAGDISAGQTTIAVADDTALPDAPNICTIGYGEHIETIRYGTKSNGVLQDVTRGIEGTPRAWPSGTEVARFYTAYEHNKIVDSITVLGGDVGKLKEDVGEIGELETEEKGNLVEALNGVAGDLTSHLAESAFKHIHSSGSNANGKYIKFDDGTMICTGRFSTLTDINSTQGMASGWNRNVTTYYTNNQFLKPFIEVPDMSYTIRVAGYDVRDIMIGMDFSTTTEARPQLISPRAHTEASLEISYTAIGRWR